ncbi:MAG: helix-turn-helix domain-containing protein, partial [Oscillospiraceae bacterium]|nr:helix-turn-helix domain-containing protein [Oscillospiraceae bacterium]
MAVYRVERTQGYTVMSNYHLKDTALSLKAKGLLSMFLSFPDDWNYSTRGLASICKEGVEAIGNTIKELEKAGYIVRRQLRGANGRITDTEYVIFERPQDPELPAPDDTDPDTPPDTDTPDTVSPDTGNPDMVKPDMENRPELNIKKSRTKKSITQRSNTHSFPPPAPSAPPAAPAAPVEGMKEILEKRAEIEDQIEYELIVGQTNREQLNEFVEIMLEVALSRTPTMKIGRDAEYPTAFVQHRFEQLTSAHIEKVLDGIQENTTRVWNTRAYLLAALFNAP